MFVTADACRLPFRTGTFDLVFGSPPWDDLDVVMHARHEMTRVLSRRGEIVMVLPHLDDPNKATLAVSNRDWTVRSQYVVDKPVENKGWVYRSMSDDLARQVLSRSRSRRVLDPFSGTGTIVKMARSMGRFAAGCDLSPVASRLAMAGA